MDLNLHQGKFAWGHINSDDRLTMPLLRDGDSFREVSWDEAPGCD